MKYSGVKSMKLNLLQSLSSVIFYIHHAKKTYDANFSVLCEYRSTHKSDYNKWDKPIFFLHQICKIFKHSYHTTYFLGKVHNQTLYVECKDST